MYSSTLKSISRLTMLVATIAIGSIIWWSLEVPNIDHRASEVPPRSMTDPQTSIPEIPQYTALAPLLDQKLRGPLYDPPPAEPPKQEPPPPPPPIRIDLRLVGTVLEAGRNQAMFADADGKILFCRVGEPIDSQPGGLSLESVSETDAVLRVTEPRSELVTLTIERDN
ncbi:MAG: hypothetical protein AAFX06_08740 [Planctomycetota bacterium]